LSIALINHLGTFARNQAGAHFCSWCLTNLGAGIFLVKIWKLYSLFLCSYRPFLYFVGQQCFYSMFYILPDSSVVPVLNFSVHIQG
jgi:hypothetical protein